MPHLDNLSDRAVSGRIQINHFAVAAAVGCQRNPFRIPTKIRFDACIFRLATKRRAVILCKQTFFIQLFPNPVLFDNPPDRQPFFARQHDLLAGFAVGNRMKQLIDRINAQLERLKRQYPEASVRHEADFSLNKGADEADFAELEKELGYALPEDFKELYRISFPVSVK